MKAKQQSLLRTSTAFAHMHKARPTMYHRGNERVYGLALNLACRIDIEPVYVNDPTVTVIARYHESKITSTVLEVTVPNTVGNMSQAIQVCVDALRLYQYQCTR